MSVAPYDDIEEPNEPDIASMGMGGGMFTPAYLAHIAKCPDCGDQYVSPETLQVHRETDHPERGPSAKPE